MLSSLKKWVQDVAVDLAPPPSPPPPLPSSSSSFVSSSSMPGSTHHYFYSTTRLGEQQDSRKSSLSGVYLSRPISLDSMRSTRTNTVLIPPPLVSPAELDLSHLNREEQEHIANVLKRARAVEEQSTLPSVTVPSIPSPPVSISPSISSSSTSTSSFVSEQLEKYDKEIPDEAEKIVIPTESILTTIHQCQTCGRERPENSTICFQCQENESIEREIENNTISLNQQLISINKTLSYNNHEEEEEDKIYDNIMKIKLDRNHIHTENQDQSILYDISRTNNLTEIDENDFFYEEPSPYEAAIISNNNKEEIIPSYKIDELIDDDDDNDERDHVKELEETIANLSRHFPSEHIQKDSTPINKIDTDSILEMEIESSSPDELSFHPPTHPLTLSISVPIPINNRRGSLSRSSGIRENLTDLLIPTTSISQQTLSTHNKRMLSINRHKRNLPSVPSTTLANRLQLRRANSESRFTLPAVPFPILIPQQNLDDESDLLEIDLNDPIGSMNRTLKSQTESENNQYKIISKTKQIRDQTTNTPPISNFNSSIKSKKKLRKKISSVSNQTSPTITKLQKSTSTEITYPFPVIKLILNPSRHGISTDLGFRIIGGHSSPNCMEVTAYIENINTNHRNYQILKNIVQEGDEVLELGGVSLRGKSALFIENLMNTIQNEFEIIIRNQSININSKSSLTTDVNIQRRHSMDTSQLPSTESTNNIVSKSKSTPIYSLPQTVEIIKEEKPSTNEESPNLFSHRQRASLLPNDPGINGAGSNISIDRQNSNESDESDSLSQYFHLSQSRKGSLMTSGDAPISHGRSQSVIPFANDTINPSTRLQNFLKSDPKRPSRASASTERKSSLSFGPFKFLKKKTKSVDFSHHKNFNINPLRENDYVGDIELQIGHDSEREQLVVRIIQAKNLLPKDTNGFSDPFVKIYLLPGRDQENKRRIKHISKSLNPVWDQTVIYGHMHREEVQYKKLEITVWDYDRFKANDFLGQVTIDLKNPNVINDKSHWYRLQALRSREETTNRGSSPRLFKMTSVDSSASSISTLIKNSVTKQPRINQQK